MKGSGSFCSASCVFQVAVLGGLNLEFGCFWVRGKHGHCSRFCVLPLSACVVGW